MVKIIILIVRKHAGEVDWILPILNESSKKIKIITIFNSPAAYKSLCQNNDLFILWKKINSQFFIEKKKITLYIRYYLNFLQK